MLPDRVSNPGPLTYESGALLIALRGPDYLGTALNTIGVLKFSMMNDPCNIAKLQIT